MSAYEFTLRQLPHRHYAVSVDGKKATWNGARRQRIVSVTTVLDGGQDNLTGWAARQGVAAGEQVARQFFAADAALDASILSWGEMAALMPEHPDTYRDHKADLGTRLHNYLAARLMGRVIFEVPELPYGLRAAVDAFIANEHPVACTDDAGFRVERCVGDYERAVAGTYDAQIRVVQGAKMPEGVHRIDAKSSNTLQPKHLAQVAEYERLAVLQGEEPSDWLTVVQFTPLGEYHPYSIAVGSPEHALAQQVFDAHLEIHRGLAPLRKLLTHMED